MPATRRRHEGRRGEPPGSHLRPRATPAIAPDGRERGGSVRPRGFRPVGEGFTGGGGGFGWGEPRREGEEVGIHRRRESGIGAREGRDGRSSHLCSHPRGSRPGRLLGMARYNFLSVNGERRNLRRVKRLRSQSPVPPCRWRPSWRPVGRRAHHANAPPSPARESGRRPEAPSPRRRWPPSSRRSSRPAPRSSPRQPCPPRCPRPCALAASGRRSSSSGPGRRSG